MKKETIYKITCGKSIPWFSAPLNLKYDLPLMVDNNNKETSIIDIDLENDFIHNEVKSIAFNKKFKILRYTQKNINYNPLNYYNLTAEELNIIKISVKEFVHFALGITYMLHESNYFRNIPDLVKKFSISDYLSVFKFSYVRRICIAPTNKIEKDLNECLLSANPFLSFWRPFLKNGALLDTFMAKNMIVIPDDIYITKLVYQEIRSMESFANSNLMLNNFSF